MPTRHAFTLVELLIVVAILVGLMAIGFPAYQSILRANQRSSAQALVDAAATAAADHGQTHLTISDASGDVAVHRLWDLDRDGLLDGDPARDPGFSSAERDLARDAGYHGFLATTGATVPSQRVDPATGRVTDPWGRPLRIAFDATAYAPLGFQIRSDGPDGRPDTDDDLFSGGANR